MNQNNGKIFAMSLAGGVLGALLIVGGSNIISGNFNLFGNNPTVVPNAGNNKVSKKTFKNSTDVTEAVKKVQPTVVSVINLQKAKATSDSDLWSHIFGDSDEKEDSDDSQPDPSTSLQPAAQGTGLIYKKEGANAAFVVTNAHVVEGQKAIEIVLADGTKISGKLVGKDTYSDLAVIQIDGTKISTVAVFGDSSKLNVGEITIAIGSPLGTDYANSVTQGILSSKNREVVGRNEKGETIVNANAIQTDAAINPGNSGGPLVNVQGQVIGINSSKLSSSAETGGGTSVEGMGFAIPSNDVVNVINKLEKSGKVERPALGVTLKDLNTLTKQQITKILKLNPSVKNGTVITSVNSATPADQAGLEKYDVITEINGTNIKSALELQTNLYKLNIGDTAKITYYRGKTKKTADVKLTLEKGAVKETEQKPSIN